MLIGAAVVLGVGGAALFFINRFKSQNDTSTVGASVGGYTGDAYGDWIAGQVVAPVMDAPSNGVVVNTGVGFFDSMVLGVTNFLEKRGIRNNNPGNLVITNDKWLGKVPIEKNTDGKFEQFVEPKYGLRAMFIDVRGDVEKRGQNTIRKLITAYAPPGENNTAAYINSMVYQVGIGADTKIQPVNYMNIMKAIIQQENGKQPYSDALLVESMRLAG